MKIEVSHDQPNIKERTYPWIGVSTDTGAIVLFHKRHYGTTLNKTFNYAPAIYTSWGEGGFVELVGSITLSND